jgi:outer membrane protein
MKKLLFIILTFYCYTSGAQDAWTLQQCIDYAEANNYELERIKNIQLAGEQNVLAAKGALLPTVNGSVTENHNLGRNIDPFTNVYINQEVRSNNLSLNASMVLFNGMLLQNTIKQTKNQVLSSQQDIDQYRLELRITIVQAYVSILLNEERVENSIRQAETTKGVYDRTLALKTSGVVTNSATLDVYAQWKQEEAIAIQAKNDLRLSYLNLGLLLQLPDPLAIRIQKPETTSSASTMSYNNPEDVMNLVVEQIPRLKSIEYRKESIARAYYASKGRYYPKLTVNGALTTYYSTSGKVITGKTNSTQQIGYTSPGNIPVYSDITTNTVEKEAFRPQLDHNFNKFIGLTLTIPILNGLQTRTLVHKNEIEMNQVDLDYNIAKINLQRTIYTAYYQASGSQSKLEALNESYTATEESYRNAEKRYENGIINSVEFSQLKTRLNQAQSELLMAKYDFIFKNAILDMYSGQPLSIK